MERSGEVIIHIEGHQGTIALSPETTDIRDIQAVLKDIEHILYPGSRGDRPQISYHIEDGSVKHVFKTAMQAVIAANSLLVTVESHGEIGFLEPKTASAIERLQMLARQKDYTVSFFTNLQDEPVLTMTAETDFVMGEQSWVEAEFYFYGVLKDAGGKVKTNIHLDTEEYGYLRIQADEEQLKSYPENPLYRYWGVRALGRQNPLTGEIDKQSIRLIELIDYEAKFDKKYIARLIERAQGHWGRTPEDDLNEMRGGYEL